MASSKVVPDQQVRDRFTRERGTSHFLKAGAGAGKSTSVVSRVVGTLADPAADLAIGNIVAITFTKRAAADLRHKLRQALEEKSRQAGSPRIDAALRDLDTAQVGTIHSFAQTILTRFALEAGLPPGFDVASEGDSVAARKSRARDALAAVPDLTQGESVFSMFGVAMKTLVEAVVELDGKDSRIDDDAFAAGMRADARAADEAWGIIHAEYQSLTSICSDATDKLRVKIEEHYATIAGFTTMSVQELGAYWPQAWGSKNLQVVVLGGIGSGPNWGGDAKGARARWQALEPHVEAILLAPVRQAMWELMREARASLREAQGARRAAGELEFDDLLTMARELVESNAEVRSTLHRDYRLILVDEFQDTDPVQWDLVKAISSGGDPTGPRPGSLVVVGDAKQAIYSFRGADVRTYDRAEGEFIGGTSGFGVRESLAVNFRSQRAIVDWVNATFAPAFASQEPHQVGYEPMVAIRDDVLRGPAVTLLRTPEGEEMKAPEIEARMVAQTVATAVADGWQVMSSADEPRSCRLSDIAVLYPTRTSLDILLNELDLQGIAYRSSDAALVFDRTVVSGTAHLLRVMAEPGNSVSLWWALKSPLFGLTDTELAQYVAAGGGWNGPAPEDLADTPVGKALAHIERLATDARLMSPSGLIARICEETRIWEALAFTQRGRFDADCLRMLIRYALEWEAEGYVGLEAFVAQVDELQGEGSRVTLPAPDDREDDAIELMTIFGAKGLEFNIAVVAGATTQQRAETAPLRVASDGAAHLSFGGIETGGFVAFKNDIGEPERQAERMRVLYVGCTRARDHLVVSLVGEAKAKPSALCKMIGRFVAPGTDVDQWRDVAALVPVVRDALPLDADWAARLDRLRVEALRPAVALPSGAGAAALGLADGSHDEVAPEPVDGETVAQYVVAARDGADFGTCVHKAMDSVIESGVAPNRDQATALVERAAAELGLSVNLDKAAEAVAALASNETVREALAAPRRWAELQVAAPVDHEGAVLVEGFADLVFQTADGTLVLCDYKTDSAISDETMGHYRGQLAAYAEILHRASGMTVSRRCVIHVSSGLARTIEV